MSTATISPSPYLTVLDDDGSPVDGALIYTWEAGSAFSVPATTYADADMGTPNPNPVVADAAGRVTMFLAEATYDFQFKRPDGTLIRTAVDIASTALGQTGGVGQVLTDLFGTPDSPITQTAYVSGIGFSACHAGTIIIPIDSADLVGTYAIRGMLMNTGGGTTTAAIVNLSDGSPDTPLEDISSTSAGGEMVTSGPITFAAPGADKNYGIKVKVTAASVGNAWGLSLVRTA